MGPLQFAEAVSEAFSAYCHEPTSDRYHHLLELCHERPAAATIDLGDRTGILGYPHPCPECEHMRTLLGNAEEREREERRRRFEAKSQLKPTI